jgi:hypothetical protein
MLIGSTLKTFDGVIYQIYSSSHKKSRYIRKQLSRLMQK